MNRTVGLRLLATALLSLQCGVPSLDAAQSASREAARAENAVSVAGPARLSINAALNPPIGAEVASPDLDGIRIPLDGFKATISDQDTWETIRLGNSSVPAVRFKKLAVTPTASQTFESAHQSLERTGAALEKAQTDGTTSDRLASVNALVDGTAPHQDGGIPETEPPASPLGWVKPNSLPRAPRPEALDGVLSDPTLRAKWHAMRTSGKPVVTDVSLESFVRQLQGDAQLAQAAGGLGFLTDETWNAYGLLPQFHAVGVMPLYANVAGPGGVMKPIDWEKESRTRKSRIHPVIVHEPDGKDRPLRFPVEYHGSRDNEVSVYWIDCRGTPVFLLYSPRIFRRLYPDGEEQIHQYAFLARAYVELMKKLDVAPDIVRLNEPQLVFVANAAKDDVDWHNHNGTKSVFDATHFAMTTHTPEHAALPIWDAGWLKERIGAELVRDWPGAGEDVEGRLANAAFGLARMADSVNAVSAEHEKVTKEVVLPEFKDKIVGIQNGSDPDLWYSGELRKRVRRAGSLEEISGEELFKIGAKQKIKLNNYLKTEFGVSFREPDRPLVSLVRRLVEYKEQGMLLPLISWIVGDRDNQYDTPWGRKYGLGANILIGGQARDGMGEQWKREFQELMLKPELAGRFIFVESTGIQLLRHATAASDIWVSMPRPTREASGTSDQRAALNGHLNIATATGGPLAYIEHGKNGWLIDVFKDRPFSEIVLGFEARNPELIKEYRGRGMEALARYMAEGVRSYYDYVQGRSTKWTEAMRYAFLAAHKEVSINAMIRKYGLLFESILDGTGAEGFKRKLEQTKSARPPIAATN